MTENMPQSGNHNSNIYTENPVQTAPVAPARPKAVDLGIKMLVAALVVTLCSIPAGLAVWNSEAYHTALEDFYGFNIDVPATVAAGITTLIANATLRAVVLLLAVIFIYRSHGWPRIVLTVLAVLSFLYVMRLFAYNVPVMVNVLMTLAAAVLTLAATVVLYLPAAGKYFAAMKQYRKAGKTRQV